MSRFLIAFLGALFLTVTLPLFAPAIFFNKKSDDFTKETFNLVPGIDRHLITLRNSLGPVIINVLEVDLLNENISLKVGIPSKFQIKGMDTLLNIVEREMAFAGINANYFDKEGAPIGTVITEGKWLSGSLFNRVAIGFSEEKDVLIEQIMLTGTLSVSRGLFKKKPVMMVDVESFNTPPQLCNGINLITAEWERKIKLPKNKFAYVVKDKCIRSKDKGTVTIPEGSYVLVGDKRGKIESLKTRDCLDVYWGTVPDWSGVKEAVSGGPYLLMNGEIYIDEGDEKIHFAERDKYAPRTAIGIDENNKLYLIAVDGRQEGYSVGLSLVELAELLKKLNIKDAINLDGGGSTTIVADGKVLNKPSDKSEREISNSLLIFYESK